MQRALPSADVYFDSLGEGAAHFDHRVSCSLIDGSVRIEPREEH